LPRGEDIYVINPDRRIECVGHFDESQCVAVCPVDAIVPDPERAESREALEATFSHLQA
jgi:ferredoxin